MDGGGWCHACMQEAAWPLLLPRARPAAHSSNSPRPKMRTDWMHAWGCMHGWWHASGFLHSCFFPPWPLLLPSARLACPPSRPPRPSALCCSPLNLGGSLFVSFGCMDGPTLYTYTYVYILHIFFHVHPMVVKVFLIFHRGLKVVLLENVTGALKSSRGQIPFFDKLLLALRTSVPFWRWGVDEVNCKDYLSAQSRPRVVLRGTMEGSATE